MKSRKITNWGKEMATAVKWIGRDTVKSRIKKNEMESQAPNALSHKICSSATKMKNGLAKWCLKSALLHSICFHSEFLSTIFPFSCSQRGWFHKHTDTLSLYLYLLTRIFDCSFHDSNQLNWSKQNNSIQTLTPSEPLLLHITRQASKRIMDTFIIASNHLVNICARCYSVQCRQKCQRNDKHPMSLTNTSKTTLTTIIGAIETNDNDGPALSFQTNQTE